MTKNLKNYLIQLQIVMLYACLVSACTKNGSTPSSNKTTTTSVTIADQISGSFSGTGKRLAAGINLGTYSGGCIVPSGWQNNTATGTATLDIAKIDSTEIRLTFVGGPFLGSDSYVKNIVKSGNSIILSGSSAFPGEALTYDIDTKLISAAIFPGTSYYVPSPACTTGLPYYYGVLNIVNLEYTYITLGNIAFAGTKN